MHICGYAGGQPCAVHYGAMRYRADIFIVYTRGAVHYLNLSLLPDVHSLTETLTSMTVAIIN